MEQRVVVIGLGIFGNAVAKEMTRNGAEVLAIDIDSECVETIKDDVTHAIVLDSTDEAALQEQGVANFDVAVVAIGMNFESAMITTSILKRLGVNNIHARATSTRKGELLQKIGGDSTQIINPEESAGKQLALVLLTRGADSVKEITEELLIVTRRAPKVFWKKSLAELNIRGKYHVNVVAIKKPTKKIDARSGKPIEEINDSPGPGDIIQEGDKLLVACSRSNIDNLPYLE